jgi:hypothetical protein
MALQHTLNASPIQAFRSSDVSATAVEHKKALVKTAIIVANSFIDFRPSGARIHRPPEQHHKMTLASAL